MSSEKPSTPPWTYRTDVSSTGQTAATPAAPNPAEAANLLQFLATVQSQQLELTRQIQETQRQIFDIQRQQLEILRENLHYTRDQRARQISDLERWQNGHEDIIDSCKLALGQLEPVHASLMRELTVFVEENHDNLMEGDYSLSDFVDRFGPKLAHLNTILSILRPLAAANKKQDSKPGDQTSS